MLNKPCSETCICVVPSLCAVLVHTAAFILPRTVASQDPIRNVDDLCGIVDMCESLVQLCKDAMLPGPVQLQVWFGIAAGEPGPSARFT